MSQQDPTVQYICGAASAQGEYAGDARPDLVECG